MLLYNLILEKYDPETLVLIRETIHTVTQLQKAIKGIVPFSAKLQPIMLKTKHEFAGTTTAALTVQILSLFKPIDNKSKVI